MHFLKIFSECDCIQIFIYYKSVIKKHIYIEIIFLKMCLTHDVLFLFLQNQYLSNYILLVQLLNIIIFITTYIIST